MNLTVVGLRSFLQLLTSAVVVVALLMGLLFIDAPVALAAAALFGVVYGLFAITARRELRRNGQKIATASRQQLKALQEGWVPFAMCCSMAANHYLQDYRQADHPQRQLQAQNFS